MKELNDFRTAIDNNLKADNERLTNELKAKNLLNDKFIKYLVNSKIINPTQIKFNEYDNRNNNNE
jgi:hypothetical protein